MLKCIFTALLIATEILLIACQDAEKKQSLYNKLCYNPNNTLASTTFNMIKFSENEPDGGWPIVLANDVSANYFGSVFKGRKILRTDTSQYEGMCFTAEKSTKRIGNKHIGYFNGYGRQQAVQYTCEIPEGFPNAVECVDETTSSQSYKIKYFFYFTDTSHKNVHVLVDCFPELEEVGWATMSDAKSFTEPDFAAVKQQVESLGFDKNNFMYLYGPECLK